MVPTKPISVSILVKDVNENIVYRTEYYTNGFITGLAYDKEFATFMDALQTQYPDCELEYHAMKE